MPKAYAPGGARRIAGAHSPRTAVLIDDRGERLICTYNDPTLDDEPSRLPVASLAGGDAVLADIRWTAGAAFVFDAARAAHVPTVLDADVAPVAALRDLCARCDYAIFSQPGLNVASGATTPATGCGQVKRIARGVVGVTLGTDGFLWLDAGRERQAAPPAMGSTPRLLLR